MAVRSKGTIVATTISKTTGPTKAVELSVKCVTSFDQPLCAVTWEVRLVYPRNPVLGALQAFHVIAVSRVHSLQRCGHSLQPTKYIYRNVQDQ
jgi:hypothetical protein